MKRLPILFGCLIIVCVCYFNTPYYLQNYRWKSCGGGRISDMIDFNTEGGFILKWPKIYMDNKYVGSVVFCIYDRLWIYSARHDMEIGIGEYVAKSK